MGLAGRKPLLPAPTESLVDESAVEEPGLVEDVSTDLSVRTDRTHHTIPEDGSPITITTKSKSSRLDKITTSTQNSQTSLLIEYFEGGKSSEPGRKPSVRVKVIPSRSKNKDKGEGHIVLTEARGVGTKNLSTSRRISLGSRSPQIAAAGSDISVLESLHIPAPRGSAPLDIEIQQGSDMSELSASPEARYIPAPSDISSMPPDSMLGVAQSTLFHPPPKVIEGSNVSSLPPEESVLSGSEVMESASLKPPFIPRERNASNERITQKVIEKLSNKPREPLKAGYGRSERSSSRSTSREVTANPHERTRMTGKNFRETDSTLASATEPSILSNSVISIGGRSDHSAKSNNSINNPKLLQTVEDAIRRLILPELKELKKDQRHQPINPKYDNSYSDLSENSIIQEKPARRSTSGSKSRRRSSSSKEHAEISGSRKRKSRQIEIVKDSLSDSGSRRDASVSSISVEDPALRKRNGSSHRARDVAAAGIAGAGLTAAALHERDSEDSLQRRRRRKRSKSRSSRGGSIAESEEIFEKHKVPPMPMRSDLSSDLTRSSLLSSNTATSHTPTQREIQQVVRGSPRELLSPASNPTPRMSGDLRQSLGTHHGNFSEHNLSANRLAYDETDDASLSPETDQYHSFSAEDILTDQERLRQYERNLHTQHPIRRGLSPIQSVASYQTTEPNRHSMHHPRSQDSLASMKRRQQQLKEEVSISSFTSAPHSPDFKKNRISGITRDNKHQNLTGQAKDLKRSPDFQSIGIHDRFSDEDHDHYRESYATDSHPIDGNRFSQMTDTSSDLQYVDKVTAGQHVVPVVGAKPEYVPAPFGVESGVASLVEPSILSGVDSRSSHKSSFVHEKVSNRSLPREELMGARVMSPPKDHISVRSGSSIKERMQSPRVDLSPPQSPARSYEEHAEEYISHDRSRSSIHSPLPEERIDEKGSPESEITTNPSVIHGPILGLSGSRADPWVADTATPPVTSHGGISRDFSSGAIDLIPEGLNVSQRNTYDTRPNTYVIGSSVPTPPGVKMDEGYQTGDNYPSPGPLMKTDPIPNNYDLEDEEYVAKIDDPFTTKRNQYMSGLSQGMSPLYDGATGRGIDRIQSKDIVALMDHLTVRDAQRNARDTEILVTLVRSAADMRNSFEEMRAFIAEQDELIMSTADKQHAQTQKVIGGPRPQPASTRGTRTPTQEDLPNKRRNVFKRALQGLGSKNTAELQNIESMLMQLLDEVEALRAQQSNQIAVSQPRNHSFASDDVARPPTDTGYEPEGRAGTASTGADRSGVFSTNSSRQGQYSAARRVPENRVSIVMEGDEEHDEYGMSGPISDNQRTPRAASPSNDHSRRAQSEPLGTPPGIRNGSQGALSNEHTPTTSYYSGDKKHKTFSSILPKVMSRWSKTTASSGGDDYRQSTQSRARPYSQVSRSGDAIHEYEYENDPDDRLRSSTSLQDEVMYREQGNRPPSPLVPSAISDNPKYQVHRDSWNLEHPQPRPGSKYQFKLENAAQTYRSDDHMSPISMSSSHRWENQQQQQSYAPRNLSPISDRGYSETGSTHQRPGSSSSLSRRNQGPPRPPKVLDNNEPLVPHRTSKLSIGGTMSPSTYIDDVRAARGSPAFDKSPVGALRSPQSGNIGRKPSGPRPISSQSNKDMQKKTRFTNSPVQSIGSDKY